MLDSMRGSANRVEKPTLVQTKLIALSTQREKYSDRSSHVHLVWGILVDVVISHVVVLVEPMWSLKTYEIDVLIDRMDVLF